MAEIVNLNRFRKALDRLPSLVVSIEAMSALIETRLRRATARRSRQNSSSSERDVAWPAITTERLRKEARIRGCASCGAEHGLGIDPAREIFGRDIAQGQGRRFER